MCPWVWETVQLNSAAIVWVRLNATTGLISGSTAFLVWQYQLYRLVVTSQPCIICCVCYPWLTGVLSWCVWCYCSSLELRSSTLAFTWPDRWATVSIIIDRKTTMPHTVVGKMIRRPDGSADTLPPKHHFSQKDTWQMQPVGPSTTNVRSESVCFYPHLTIKSLQFNRNWKSEYVFQTDSSV